MTYKSKIGLRLNVEYTHRDQDGNIKPIFTENKLGQTILRFFRKLIKNPINESGQLKEGFLNHLAAFGLQIPYITGNYSYSRKVSNLITTAGKAGVAGLINGVITDFFDYIALGTGTTAADAADTTLQTESAASGLARALATLSRVTTDTSNDTARFVKAFTNTSAGSVAVTEAGILSASSTGTLLARQVFSAVNVAVNDSITLTWDIDVD